MTIAHMISAVICCTDPYLTGNTCSDCRIICIGTSDVYSIDHSGFLTFPLVCRICRAWEILAIVRSPGSVTVRHGLFAVYSPPRIGLAFLVRKIPFPIIIIEPSCRRDMHHCSMIILKSRIADLKNLFRGDFHHFRHKIRIIVIDGPEVIFRIRQDIKSTEIYNRIVGRLEGLEVVPGLTVRADLKHEQPADTS